MSSEEIRKAKASQKLREIGPLKKIANPARRESCRHSVEKFGYTYFPNLWTKKLSKDHREILDRAMETIVHMGCFVFAMPRGVGKTLAMMILVQWAVLYGYVKYILVITAETELAKDFLRDIADELQDNELLLEDFPELKCFVALDGEPRKQGGQTVNGKKTRLRISPKMLRFPYFPKNPTVESSGAILEATSITSRLRGRGKRIDGRRVRPQFVILDDIQNDEIAASPFRVAKTLQAINKTVLGMKGTGEGMATFCIGTVIQKNDVMDTLLNHRLNPEWRGRRCKMLYSLPERMDIWEGEYLEVRNESLLKYGDLRLANAYYRKHRKVMSAGAEVEWKENYQKGEVDALQHAMELLLTNREAFFSERQNEPLVNETNANRILFNVQNLSLLKQRVVPQWATGLYVGVDVQKYMAYYVVAACDTNFTTCIIDWGTYPEQNKIDFTYDDKQIVTWIDPTQTLATCVSRGIRHLLTMLDTQRWQRENGGTMKITGGLVDGGYLGRDAVVPVLMEDMFWGRYFVSYGRAPAILREQFHEHRPRDNEVMGHYLIRAEVEDPETKTPYKYVAVYTNEWKSQLAEMCQLPIESTGSLSLYGSDPARHTMYMRHLTSEYPEMIEGRGLQIASWQKIPNAENHLLDATVYALAAASMGGCVLNKKLRIVNQSMTTDFNLEVER